MAEQPRLLIDECFDNRISRRLSELPELDLSFVSHEAKGSVDADVAQLSIRTNRILLTADKGFGDLVVIRGLKLPGLIIDRSTSWQNGLARTQEAIPKAGGAIVVLQDGGIRVKRLPEVCG